MANVHDRELFSIDDLAQLLSLAKRTIWVMVRRNELPKPHRLPGNSRLVRWRRVDLEKYLDLVHESERDVGSPKKKGDPEKKKS